MRFRASLRRPSIRCAPGEEGAGGLVRAAPFGRRTSGAFFALTTVVLAAAAGPCAEPQKRPAASEPRLPAEAAAAPYLADTIGQRARFTGREWIPVHGYGFVVGLHGTGTTVVPPGVRRQVLFIMRRHRVENPEAVLASPDTAVVAVIGHIPPGAVKGETFDIEVRALPNTDTTSLEGGFLLEADLTRVAVGRTGELHSQPLALARGGIFVGLIDPAGTAGAADLRSGRVLAGGKALESRSFHLVLRDPSIRTVDQIVRVINSRFPGAAKGTRDGRVDLTVPPAFRTDKGRFLDILGAMYLPEAPAARETRIRLLTDRLQEGQDLEIVALCLEAFGPVAAPHLKALAEHPQETVRFYVGRILARAQDGLGVRMLEPLALSDASAYQEAAVRATGESDLPLTVGVLTRALDAKSARVRIAAWRAIMKASPGATIVAAYPDKFILSRVPTRAGDFVYVARSDEPHLAIFGDVRIAPPVLARTRDVTVSATLGAPHLTVVADRAGRHIGLELPLDLEAAIRIMADPITREDQTAVTGLDLSYSEIVSLIYQMAQRKALTGPMVLQPLEYRAAADRPITMPPVAPPEEAGPADEGPTPAPAP